MKKAVTGVVPVMLTPYARDGSIDESGFQRLTTWYLANGADALFAVCQSSEMHKLSIGERVALARQTARIVDGRVPVLASGHIAGSREQQAIELKAMAITGIDVLVLVTNRLPDARGASDADVIGELSWLMDQLPADLPLGLYECPMPWRRLLSDDVLKFCADSGRFVALKDVSCDLQTIRRRVELVKDSPLAILNANATIAWPAMQSGAQGFCGVMANFHPDLYAWLYHQGRHHTGIAQEVSVFLALAGLTESQGYPAVAKRFHQRLGTFESIACRNMDSNTHIDYPALEALLDYLEQGAQIYRERVSRLLRVVK